MKKNIVYPENRNGGIYAIINKDNGRIYIGETENLRKRAKAHVNLLKAGNHYCKDLQEDYDNNFKKELKTIKRKGWRKSSPTHKNHTK